MTASKAIELCDELKPNSYDTAQKLRWLAELDGIIMNEVILTHICSDGSDGTDEAGGEKQLIVKAPYEGIYTAYLSMQIDRANNDAARYANSAAAFSSQYADFLSYFNRTHMPTQKNQRFKLLRRG